MQRNNPFYIEPTGATGTLQGLGALAQGYMTGQQKRQEQEQKQLQQQEIQGAFDSRKPLEIANVMSKYPDMAKNIESRFNFQNTQSKQNFSDTMRKIWTGGDPETLLSQRAQFVEGMGGDPTETMQSLEAYRADPEGYAKKAEMAYAAVDPQGYTAAKTALGGKATGPKIGTYIPDKYTVESWDKFIETGDQGVLERYVSPAVKSKLQTEGQLNELNLLLKRQQVEAEKRDATAKELDRARDEKDVATANELERIEAQTAIGGVDYLLGKSRDEKGNLVEIDLDDIYGAGEKFFPNLLYDQTSEDMVNIRDQIVSTLQLAAAGKLKGQGTITDPEREMLARAATLLNNETLSPERARKELEKVRTLFETKMLLQGGGVNEPNQKQTQQTQQTQQSKDYSELW